MEREWSESSAKTEKSPDRSNSLAPLRIAPETRSLDGWVEKQLLPDDLEGESAGRQ